MIRIALLSATLVLVSSAAWAAPLPQWARDLARTSAGDRTVILLDQVDVVVSEGKLRTTTRYAVAIGDRESRHAAAVRQSYVTGSGKVNQLRAWIVGAGGDVRELGDRDIVDAALVNNDVYNEVRVKLISAADQIGPRDVFVAEVQSEEPLLFSQLEWMMQDRWPTRLARRSLTLPAQWRATSVTFNGASIEPRHEGDALVWELRDVAGFPDELAMPPATSVAPRIAVSFFAPDTARSAGQFATWSDVSSWLFGLSDAPSRSGPAISVKARELTASATTNVERVVAIARYVQRVQYISIQTGLGRGGGYQPRPASLVLERNYGDCKDKASLMRAMLAAVGINSYMVSIYSGDRTYVRAEWASPQQFNHAIIAVALPDVPVDLPASTDHLTLGRLVMFDPTDEFTPFGELPQSEQGSLALIIAPTGGALVQMPTAPADAARTRRSIDGVIAPNGVLTARVEEYFAGPAATAVRARRAVLRDDDYRAVLESRLARTIAGARVKSTTVDDDPVTRAVKVVTVVEAPAFVQRQGTLMLFAPPLQLDERIEIPSAKDRKTAVSIEPIRVDERVRVRLPAGLVVDEKPAPVVLDTPFGRYALSYAIENGLLAAARKLDTPPQTIPSDQLPAARAFFDAVRAADTALVAMVTK